MNRQLLVEIKSMLELHLSAKQIARRLGINIDEVKLAITAIKSY